MLIDLKASAQSHHTHTASFEINERLPSFLEGPCVVACQYVIEKRQDFYLISLQTAADLSLICQRCLQTFKHAYTNNTELAVFESEELAEKHMSEYECFVAKTRQIDLVELVTDELYLYCPTMHVDTQVCDDEVGRYLS